MAQITKAGWVLVLTVALTGLGSAAWYLIKDHKAASDNPSIINSTDNRVAPTPSAGPVATQGLGSDSNPLKVSLVSFHGYGPGILANGSSLTTKAGSIYAKLGLNLKFTLDDNIPTLSDLFQQSTAHCAWRTSDFWAQEHPNLRNNKMDGAGVMIVDNTQGADAIISRDPNIRTVEDLAGRRVGLVRFTPSHGMTIDALQNSSLSARKRGTVSFVYVNADEGTPGVRAIFEAGNVDAVALWDPDLSLAMRTPGAHVVYSTKTATNLIYDIMVCDKRVLATAEGEAAVQKFVAGWMEGVKAARADTNKVVDALIQAEPMFKQLAEKEGRGFIHGLFSNLVWTGLEDNARILGMTGGTNHYERVYTQFDQIYRAEGALANPNSPVIPAQQSFDYRFIKSMVDKNATAVQAEAAKAEPVFTQAGLSKAAQVDTKTVTKPVQVTFASGSAELTQRAKQVLDKEMVPLIESNGSAYFELSGNTDSVGSESANQALSQARAKAVRDYLVRQWEFSVERFRVVGNGSSKPICNESNPGADGLSLDECRAANRSTRIGVYSR